MTISSRSSAKARYRYLDRGWRRADPVWLALHSWRLVAAVVFSLMVGLAATAALGLAMSERSI